MELDYNQMELDPNQQPSNQNQSMGIFIPVRGKTICMDEIRIECQNDQQQTDIECIIEELYKLTGCKNCSATDLDHDQTVQATDESPGTW